MPPKLNTIENLYRRILLEIPDPADQCRALLKIYYDLVLQISDSSQLQFNTLFARVSFLSSRYQLNRAWSYALQIPRREMHQRQLTDSELLPVLQADIELLLQLGNGDSFSPADLQKSRVPSLPVSLRQRKTGKLKKQFARVVATEWDRDKKVLHILDEDEPDQVWILHYHVHGVNDIFSTTIELALTEIGLPLVLGLADVEIGDDRQYTPGYILILPDLLMDVTTIAEHTSAGADPPAFNLLDHFLPSASSTANLAGKVANYFLDELIRDTSLTFQDLFVRSFKIFPIEFVRLSDDQVRTLMAQLEVHYTNILEVITRRFPALGIDRARCVLEPSYFSPQYGIKGRLDVFFLHEKQKAASIIELKSGKPFRPNSYGLSHTHYHQTLLYEMLIKSVHGPTLARSNYILYSSMTDNSLRYAASIDSIQKEAMQNRNEVALLQHRMMVMDQPGARDIFEEIDPVKFESIKGFQRTNMTRFHEQYGALSGAERQYLKRFTAFISREHMLARIGDETSDGTGGLAGLWLDTYARKEERYQILRGLELVHIKQDDQQTTIEFRRGSTTNPLANFRAGDIAILYPFDAEERSDPTRYQLHRAGIIAADPPMFVVRLRNHQVDVAQISSIPRWNIEHDLLDSSFRSLYQSLWMLMTTDLQRRRMILGQASPPIGRPVKEFPVPSRMTDRQKAVYAEGLSADFFYLLWGPPGTGKTSIMLKHWVRYYVAHTTDRLLLLAYTNRAVDEICAALESSDDTVMQQYIRIGSRAAAGERYRHRLLDQLIHPMTKRSEIKALLHESRIMVATVASMQGKSEIFDLVPFHVAIIDEASQLPEPAIVGLITRVKKTILIGDHMQLPAVSGQSERANIIPKEVTWADQIGLTDLRMSYFERMYRHYHSRGWSHLIGTLHEQGRMHEDIMRYANAYIYEGRLTCVEKPRLRVSMESVFPGQTSQVVKSRMMFIPSEVALPEVYTRTNQYEAEVVIRLVIEWKKVLKAHQLDWSIGVITPFRAQIAAILHLAHQRDIDLRDVSIDTVERYQGGARDIIIMSCAANNANSLSRISSLNVEGVDRKLNVAITRARHQFILTGVQAVLESSPAYSALIKMSAVHDGDLTLKDTQQVYQPEA